jgi:DNA polymerase-3 subunit gamma/tau
MLDDLARDLQRVAVYQLVGASDCDDEISEQEIAALADLLTPEDTQLFYQIAITGRRDLHLAPDPRSGAEMTLLRMLAFRPAAVEVAAGPAGARPVSKAPTESATPMTAGNAVRPAPEKVATQEWQEPDWSRLVTQLGLTGAVKLLASNCAFLRRDGNTIYLGLDPKSESLLTKQRSDLVADVLSEWFGERLSVDISMGAAASETPVQQESRLADERMEAARLELEADPNVQAMKSIFGAEIKPETIELISPSRSD